MGDGIIAGDEQRWQTFYETLVWIIHNKGTNNFIHFRKLKPLLREEWDGNFEERFWGFKKMKHMIISM